MDYKVEILTLIDFQYLSEKTPVVASRQFRLSSQLVAEFALKKTDERNLLSNTPP